MNGCLMLLPQRIVYVFGALGCINAHTDAAVKAGVTKEEIVDALGFAIMANAGAAMVYSARTIDAYDAKTE
jgi:alkylhydroperoxidase/carboxymuconolactone decarboxylase family protein YurZ